MRNRFYIKNLTLVIIFAQVISFFLIYSRIIPYSLLTLNPSLVIKGEIWRVLSFVVLPPGTNPIWVLFSWYIFYLMGSSLENYWGEFKFNLYILISILLTNITSFVFNVEIVTNDNIRNSIFLAFAFLYPNFQIMLFFILPIKVKWIALITWVLYGVQFFLGGLTVKLLLLGAVLNFLLFFTKDLYYKLRYGKRIITTKINKKIKESTHFHKCDICGVSDKDYPTLEFRYCSLCNPHKCICENCLQNHKH